MSRLAILNVEPRGYSAAARAVLEQVGTVTEVALDRAALLGRVAETDVLITRLAHRIDRPMFEAGRRLRAVVSATTGLDHIDLKAAAAREVAILSLRGETAFLNTVTATAEHAWGLLLAVARRVPAAHEAVRAGRWDRDGLRGHELHGRRLGIVGLGRLGRMVARYGTAFGMAVAATDPDGRDWPRDVERITRLDTLLAQSDVLSLHAPLRAETAGMIDAAALARLPRGAVLINTARGALVDERALADALTTGHLAGAGIDVIDDERGRGPRLSPLVAYARAHDNMVITPHIGGATVESMAKTELFLARKLAAMLGARS